MEKAAQIILDNKQSIAKKTRALFYLRNIVTDESANYLEKAFISDSVLLKHEIAYVLGQMRLESSIDTLISVLNNINEDEIVRHEAGEALGNYEYNTKIYDCLIKHLNSTSIPVKETCYLALIKLKKNKDVISKFGSRDPAILGDFESAEHARNVLFESTCLYKKYQAMFYLRDLGTEDAIRYLGEGFNQESALLKHEIAFVFGQMRNEKGVPYLIKGMHAESEHGMVRHECAEALGIIGTKECLDALLIHKDSKCVILRESVEVAIDLYGYINSNGEYCVI